MMHARTAAALRRITMTLAGAYVLAALTACALLAPLGKDDEARQAAKIALTAYETTQQAILIYRRLPTCDAEAGVTRLCKDRNVWSRIKSVEKAASTAIAKAAPVLNGAQPDSGQVVVALAAIEDVRNAIAEAQRNLKGAGS